jgi:hypothetical protein
LIVNEAKEALNVDNLNSEQQISDTNKVPEIQEQISSESSKNQLNIPIDIQQQNSLNSDKLINPDKTINTDAKTTVEQFLREQNVL